MVDRHDNQPNSPIDPSLMDTQRLLLGVDPAAGELFDLEDILAEYSGRSEPTESPEPPADAPPQEDAAPPKPEERQDEPLPEAHAAPEEPAPSLLRRLFRRRAPAKGETPPAGEVPEEAERQEVPANPIPPEAAAPAPPEAPPVPVPPPEEEDESLEDDGNLEELLDMVFWEGLGVTEAGTPSMGMIKSAMGIGGLLCLGIGDTLRVTLTADPVEEVYAAKKILRAAGLRKDGPDLIACPTCGRTRIDLIPIAEEVERRLEDCEKNITVAVMGCAVNGPGEASAADIGIAGGKGEGLLFRKGEILYKVPQERLVDALMEEIGRL